MPEVKVYVIWTCLQHHLQKCNKVLHSVIEVGARQLQDWRLELLI